MPEPETTEPGETKKSKEAGETGEPESPEESAEPEESEKADQTQDTVVESSDRPSDNPAIARCMRAFQYAYNKKLGELDEDDDVYEAHKFARRFYLRVMPPLSGRKNIREFIACVSYALVTDIIRQFEAERFFAAAKVAIAGMERESKTLDGTPRGPGRPRTREPKNN
jgi:hypothetical protein